MATVSIDARVQDEPGQQISEPESELESAPSPHDGTPFDAGGGSDGDSSPPTLGRSAHDSQGSASDVARAASAECGSAESNDRRRAGRAGVTVRIDYATVDEMFSEFTRDINAGGLFIETDKPHPPGTEVSMQFHLPGSPDVLQTIGRVVRVCEGESAAPAGMGIEFDELTAEDRVKIDRIVRALRASSGSF